MGKRKKQRRCVRLRRLGRFFGGVVLPTICFLLAADFGPIWQDGSFGSYVEIFLSSDVSVVFMPFLLFAMGGLVASLWWPRSRQWMITRLALASGIFLSLQYAGAVFLILAFEPGRFDRSNAFWALLLAVSAQKWVANLLSRLKNFLGGRGFTLLLLGVYWLGLFSFGLLKGSLQDWLLIPFNVLVPVSIIYFLGSAPSWSLRIYGGLASKFSIWKLGHISIWTRLGLTLGWLVAWTLAWREGLRRLLLAYAELPTEQPPDCFIATAAARGHRRLIGSEIAETEGGKGFPATLQLRRFKAAEWLLRALFPRFHAFLRWFYDRLGPWAARRLNRPWRADLAWLALKPFEWLAWLILRVAIPGSRGLVARVWPAQR